MNLEFLTPELFNTFVVANLVLGISLAGWRFYVDMRYQPEHEEHQATESQSDTRPSATPHSQQDE